jgi:predicted DNA-binding ribbon-helix-helix protein
MKVKDILKLHTDNVKWKIFTNRNGTRTSIRLPKVTWDIIESWCAKHDYSVRKFLVAVDIINQDAMNLTSAVKIIAAYMKETKDEIEF